MYLCKYYLVVVILYIIHILIKIFKSLILIIEFIQNLFSKFFFLNIQSSYIEYFKCTLQWNLKQCFNFPFLAKKIREKNFKFLEIVFDNSGKIKICIP